MNQNNDNINNLRLQVQDCEDRLRRLTHNARHHIFEQADQQLFQIRVLVHRSFATLLPSITLNVSRIASGRLRTSLDSCKSSMTLVKSSKHSSAQSLKPSSFDSSAINIF